MEIKPKKILVRHAKESTSTAPNGDSWINYWEKKTLLPIPKKCACCGKISNDMVGAHVIDEEGNLYIYPVCRECNSRYKYTKPDIPFEVRMDELVPVPNQN
ncbi:MAG: hypothetical protein OSJ36_06145 [Odoribacter sp.]|nr:hypothetical protein [Odoribacter sp.]